MRVFARCLLCPKPTRGGILLLMPTAHKITQLTWCVQRNPPNGSPKRPVLYRLAMQSWCCTVCTFSTSCAWPVRFIHFYAGSPRQLGANIYSRELVAWLPFVSRRHTARRERGQQVESRGIFENNRGLTVPQTIE
jgi:hypothetical protein